MAGIGCDGFGTVGDDLEVTDAILTASGWRMLNKRVSCSRPLVLDTVDVDVRTPASRSSIPVEGRLPGKAGGFVLVEAGAAGRAGQLRVMALRRLQALLLVILRARRGERRSGG